MRNIFHTAAPKNNYSQVISGFPAMLNSLRVADRNPAVKEFSTIYQYHAQVVQHLAGVKAAAELSPTAKNIYQGEFISLSMQTIGEYSLLLTDVVRRIAASGLKNYSHMILCGASLFLGGDADGNFFKKAAAMVNQQFSNRNNHFRLTSCTGRKEDYGIYTAFIQELLAELKSFCHDHPLYKDIIALLGKAG